MENSLKKSDNCYCFLSHAFSIFANNAKCCFLNIFSTTGIMGSRVSKFTVSTILHPWDISAISKTILIFKIPITLAPIITVFLSRLETIVALYETVTGKNNTDNFSKNRNSLFPNGFAL